MVLSMFDQMYFRLACGHHVIVGRLKSDSWICEECGRTTDLDAEPFRTELARTRDTADQIDKQKMERGLTIERAG